MDTESMDVDRIPILSINPKHWAIVPVRGEHMLLKDGKMIARFTEREDAEWYVEWRERVTAAAREHVAGDCDWPWKDEWSFDGHRVVAAVNCPLEGNPYGPDEE